MKFENYRVELNSILLKLFCYVAWFDLRQNWRPSKQGSIEDNSKRFIVKIMRTYDLAKIKEKKTLYVIRESR